MISEEYEFGKVSILNRRKYTLIIDEDTNGSFIRFTVLPESSLKLRKSKRNERVEVKMGVQYHRIALMLLSNVVFYGICVGTRLLEYISEIFGLRTWTNCQTIIIMGLFALCTVMFVREPSVETVTIFKGTGLQLSRVNGIVVFPQKWNRRLFERVEFISNDRIIDVVINEGFYRGFQVIFYLAAIVRNASKLKLLFPSNLPNIDDQRLIYNISRKYLNERAKPLHRPKD
ncbi:phosphatidylinositol N-acetylglucosaminyltransferase GPI15 [Saccharomyces eubayanus]|uniref:phosphatidylinositol N-acetylglucosaminyltransferase GPI15 n=1 Tax=Saccharomyces eubayanus TaxID=1080349 RepID=UPI0006C19B7F|nr:GPI15-like protein [Saccharomyces eubayanus]KOG97116.1 GPI15-like protein [Saccharomyces eubayanus]